jgi:peroxiredoxin
VANGKKLKAGVTIPEIVLKDENGKTVKLSQFWQEKTTIFVWLRHFG